MIYVYLILQINLTHGQKKAGDKTHRVIAESAL